MGNPIIDFQAALKTQRENDKVLNQQEMNDIQREQERQKKLSLLGKVRRQQTDNDGNPDVPFSFKDEEQIEEAVNAPIPQIPRIGEIEVPYQPSVVEVPEITDEQFEEAINVPIPGLPRIGENEIPYRPMDQMIEIQPEVAPQVETKKEETRRKTDTTAMNKISGIIRDMQAEKQSGESDYEKAKRTRNITQALAAMVEGTERAGAAYAGDDLVTIAPEKGRGDLLLTIGKQAMKDVEDATKMELTDPNSKVSKTYQKIAKSKFGKMLKGVDIKSLSGAQIKDLMSKMGQFGKEKSAEELAKMAAQTEYYGARSRLAGEKADIVKPKFQYKQEEDRESDRLRYTKEIKKHDAWKEGTSVKIAMEDVGAALEAAYKKGGVSLSILGVKMAKAMGEKGVLTDKDVTRYIQDPAAYSGSHAWLKKLSSGQLTDKVYRDLKRIIHSFDKNANKKIEKAEDKILTEFVQSREGKEKEMNIDDARKYLGIKKGQRMLDATKDKVDDRKIIKTQTSQSNPNKKKVFYSDGTSEVINVK